MTPKRTSSGRPEARTADESHELGATNVCDQDPDIFQISELENPLDHPQRIFLEMGRREPCVPKQTTDPLDNISPGRSVTPGHLGFESDNELATKCCGELLESGDFETRPTVLVSRQCGCGRICPTRELGQR